ncbi:ent-kaurenoic acid oxidase-like isoform X7 [Diospyros lotus]|uniref:ent-kaurenoic acid oxidase-like isoform X5 n=1 Tax=Diospyros lotus TaxID=55363 RepID=UPI00224FDC1F|nr:ent-kaurenoic acid oxidase-like isoform X5 [Diospyros lotus]XP_052174791.1 ent-kaurenoic acid oxidase-like isoform X6 [Diospyros lotus]XP_052174792.1 ent-kaurenoic acid oxidase-like isoform X7 [Diospyros lotus]
MDRDSDMQVWVVVWIAGALPLVGWLLWRLNDVWYSRLCLSAAKLPPGHMGLPFFGEMPTFLWYFKALRRPDDFINAKRRKYGDGVGMYRSHLFGSPAIIACSPSANKFVLQSSSDFIIYWPSVELVGTRSLGAVEGAAHWRVRSLVSTAINQPRALSIISLTVQPRLLAVLKSWAQKGRIVGYTEAKKMTFENVAKLFASFEPGPLVDTLDELLVGLIRGLRAYPFYFPGTAYHHAFRCRKKAEAIFWEELERRKKSRVDGSKNKNDLMEELMKLKNEEGKPLMDMEVIDNIITLLVGGYFSTSLAMMWALYYLAEYPDVLQKLREENMQISQEKNDEFITSDDISKMKYTNKVVEETLRMANISQFLVRTATRDVDYKGYRIPKGWKIIVWNRYLHTDPENYDDPMRFNPDRWDAPAKPGTHMVFGWGSRLCAGNMLAKLQVAIFIHHLAVGYKWELVNPNAQMTYLPHPKPADGVEITFSRLGKA